MAGQRNNSSQMKELMQHEDVSSFPIEEVQSGRELSSQLSSLSSSPPPSFSSPTFSSSSSLSSSPPPSPTFSSSAATGSASASPSCSGAEPPGRRERDQPARTHQEDGGPSCCELNDLKRLPQCNRKLGELSASGTHTVLINVNFLNYNSELIAHSGRDMWSGNFVKMPSSPRSSMTVRTGITQQPTQTRRWDVVSKHLGGLARKSSASPEDVEKAVMKFNPKYKGQWSFDGLHAFVKSIPKAENYYSALFPKMAALALKLPERVKKAVPLLQRGFPATVTLSQTQIASLLANAFFCTFPHRNATTSNAEYHNYPTINFTSLFGSWSARKKEKLRAIMHYFKVVTDDRTETDGLVTFERRHLKDSELPNWKSCKKRMPKLHVTSVGAIETEGSGMLQVDFASSWIGGGVLGSGLLQEEILFLMNPELIVSRLFTEKLDDSECLIVTGSQQFSCYSGFGDNFEWAGPHEDHLHRDEWRRRQRQIVAIDALHFKHRKEQFSMRKVTRELNKAFCGFKGGGGEEPDIATGRWGCGAFNGDPQLKAVIQLMAAAKAERGVAFFTFEDEKLKRGLQQVHQLLLSDGTTVGKLYGVLEDFCSSQHSSSKAVPELFDFLRTSIRGSRSLL